MEGLNPVTIERAVELPIATVKLVRLDVPSEIDWVHIPTDGLRLDLCLTARPTHVRGCFPERWGPNRFERIGEVFVMPIGEMLKFLSDGGQHHSLLCDLRPQALGEWFDRDIEWTNPRLLSSLDLDNSRITALLHFLAEELRSPATHSETMTELIVRQIAIEVGRHFGAIDEEAEAGGLAAWRLKLIDERLANMNVPPSLSELADLCRVSVRQLTRGFRTSRGYSIGDYIAKCRIDMAKRLLASGRPIKDVSFEVGFASASGFCETFRRNTGHTPRQFRAQYLQRSH